MRGALLALAIFALYMVPLVLLGTLVGLLLGPGPHDTAWGWLTMIYTVAWVGAVVDWMAR